MYLGCAECHPIASRTQDLAPGDRPAIVVGCLRYGARRAAAKLAGAGAPVVVWLRSNVLDADTAARVLFGVVAPLLEKLHMPAMAHCSVSAATQAVVACGRAVFGGAWNAGGSRSAKSAQFTPS